MAVWKNIMWKKDKRVVNIIFSYDIKNINLGRGKEDENLREENQDLKIMGVGKNIKL